MDFFKKHLQTIWFHFFSNKSTIFTKLKLKPIHSFHLTRANYFIQKPSPVPFWKLPFGANNTEIKSYMTHFSSPNARKYLFTVYIFNSILIFTFLIVTVYILHLRKGYTHLCGRTSQRSPGWRWSWRFENAAVSEYQGEPIDRSIDR